jgi:hypothetical protein
MVNRAPVTDMTTAQGFHTSIRMVATRRGSRRETGSSTTPRTSGTPVRVSSARSDRAPPRGGSCATSSTMSRGTPVQLKGSDGEYFEADPRVWTNSRVYWAQGVRRILEDRYDAILATASAAAPAAPTAASSVATRRPGGGRRGGKVLGYASPTVSAAVDAHAMTAAMGHVASPWPTHMIEQMPRNNPGFDIRVGPAGAEDWYYEVKGTQASEPLFFMSEGERKFSLREGSRYTLLVVVGIDLRNGTHASIVPRDGEVGGADVELETAQWRGRLLAR